MLATQIEVSDGTLNIINVGIEFFNQTDISVSLDQSEVPLVLGVDYQWSAATTIQFLNTVNSPGGLVPLGVQVVIRRSTKTDDMYNVYDGGAPFSRLTLDENFEQLLFLAQEYREGLGLDGLRNNLDMNGFRVVDLGTPIDSDDAATKGYVDAGDAAVTAHADSLNSKALRTPENIPALPAAAVRANRSLAFDGAGNPVLIVPSSGSAEDLAIALADPVDPYNGAGLIGRGVISVESIAELLTCPRKTDARYSVRGYFAGTSVGGGNSFYWDAVSVEVDNGGTVFAVPGVPTGRFKRGGTSGSILVDDFGAVPGVVTSQRAAIEAADSVANATGASLCFRGGVTYYADELFIKSRVVIGNNTKIVKTADTTQGFFNWGNKPDGIADGFLRGFYLDANGKNNVVNFRMYGNHTRPRVRSLVLMDSDFYAFSIGGLTTPGDKLDVINGLDIDGVYIASERGNVSLSTAYSFGLEFFPGVSCSDWRIRNVNTYGRIINKIHYVTGLDIDNINFRLSTVVDPQSSAFCEINNCTNVTVGSNCVFDTGNNNTYYALLIGGTRVPGGTAVTHFSMGGQVNGRMAIEAVQYVNTTGDFNCYNIVDLYNASNRIAFTGGYMFALRTAVGSTGSIQTLELNGVTIDGSLRLEQVAIPVTEMIVTACKFRLSTDQIRIRQVTYCLFNGGTILLRSASPLTYAISAQNANVTLHNVYIDGGANWNRPILAVDATGAIRMEKCVLDRMTSSTILASGSAALALSIGNIVNGVAVP